MLPISRKGGLFVRPLFRTTAPFSLLSFQDAKAQGEAIAEVVADGCMPPWYASDDFGHFSNRRGLSAAEKQKLLDWVRTGAERGATAVSAVGTPATADTAVARAGDRWLIGKPDLELKAPQHDIPAAGLVPYKYVTLPYLFLADTWMQAGKWTSPSNEEVCVFLMGSGMAPLRELADAIAKQRRQPTRGAKVTLIPIDGRDWGAHLPTDAPAVAKNLLAKLRGGQ